jgi:hypothetical protein
VTPPETLAAGTLLTLDGRADGREPLADPDALDRLLRELAPRLHEPDPPAPLRRVDEDGSSHLLPLEEAHLLLHAFPPHGRFAFTAFSRHALSDAELLAEVRAALRSGRCESSVRRRAAALPRDPQARARRLAGERAWARARLVPRPGLDDEGHAER